jgi:ankyrin repeat protein
MSELLDAIENGDLEQLSQIVEKDPACANTADEHDRLPLHYAAVYGHVHLVRYLIQHGADANARDGEGLQAIHKACQFGNFEVVKALLDHGVEVESLATDAAWTPLYYAAGSGDLDVIRLLISKGADVNHEDVEEGIPLHNAVRYSRLAAAKLLIKHGSNVNAEDGYTTVLCYAVESFNFNMVELIVKSGANVNRRDFDGESPLGMAERYEYDQIIDYLIEHGAKDDVSDDEEDES